MECVINNGIMVFYGEDGLIHKDNDRPAIFNLNNGNSEWYSHGRRHRENGKPAVIKDNGSLKEWWVDGVLHRDNGPAVISYGVNQYWKQGVQFDELSKDVINELIDQACSHLEKDGDYYVVYKGTNPDGTSPSVPQNSLICECYASGDFDYQPGYVYEEPHISLSFKEDCGAGINVFGRALDAVNFGTRVVKGLIAKEDLKSFYKDRFDWNIADRINPLRGLKLRVSRFEVTEVLTEPCGICGLLSKATRNANTEELYLESYRGCRCQ